jgi:hypothetical protein
MTPFSVAKRRPPTKRCLGSRHAMKCYEFFLKKIFQHPAFPFWMTDVSPIRSYISGFLKPSIPTATAAFLLFAPGAAFFAAEPQATPIPEIHRVADIFQPLSRPAELLLEPTHLVLSICYGIFLVVMAVLAYVLVCQYSGKPSRLASRSGFPQAGFHACP